MLDTDHSFPSGTISNAVPFGGIFSTSTPNALLFDEIGYHCPMGFERHYIGTSPDSQQWFYCTGLDATRPDIVALPPGYGMEEPALFDYYQVSNQTLIPVDMASPIPYSIQAEEYLRRYNFSSLAHFNQNVEGIMLSGTDEYILEDFDDSAELNYATKTKYISNFGWATCIFMSVALVIGIALLIVKRLRKYRMLQYPPASSPEDPIYVHMYKNKYESII